MQSQLAVSLPLLLLTACSSPTMSSQDAPLSEPWARTALLVGQRQLDDTEWDPVEDQFYVAIQHASIPAGQTAGHEFGVSASFGSGDALGLDFDSRIVEAFGGLRVEPESQGKLRPFFGAGLSLAYGEVEASGPGGSATIDDTVFGFYLHGGASIELSETTDLVLDVRYRTGQDAEFEGFDVDADFLVLAVGLAF
ncbi:MAG: outer membrane beta-barrel protein [Planctomycetota bacterium]